jgi:hypothetical protein
MIRVSLAVLLFVVCTGTGRADDAPASAAKTKIVLIGHQPDHPYGSHMYLHECGVLAKCLAQTAGVETAVSDGWPKDDAVLESVDALVLYTSPGGDILLKGPHEDRAEKLLADGVGYTAIHWGTGARGEELGQRYLKVLGGWYDSDSGGLDVNRARLVQVDKDHPACSGWNEYDLRDEFYLGTKFLPEAKPILKVTTAGREQVVMWSYERPDSNGGRSFGTTLGHFHDNFEIEAFRRAIVNGILWTARREVPPEGAPVSLKPEEMVLPPAPPAK